MILNLFKFRISSFVINVIQNYNFIYGSEINKEVRLTSYLKKELSLNLT